jgi:Arginine repressor, DNA binding domain
MPESPDLYAEVANLRDQIDDMSRTVSAIARRSGAKEEILDAMDKDQMLARVFLLIDGKRTQGDIVEELRKQGVSASQATVSRKLDVLIEDWDLVRKTSRNRTGTFYVKTSLARDLRIARALENKLKPGKADG